MEQIWIELCNRSIAAGWLIIAILVLRMVSAGLPKRWRFILWGFLAFRLLCPFSVRSAFSLIPGRETIPEGIDRMRQPAIDSGISSVNGWVNPVLEEQFAAQPLASANPMQVVLFILARLWILGILVLIAYSLLSYVRLRLRLRDAVACREGMEGQAGEGKAARFFKNEQRAVVYRSEKVDTPFVLGVFRPRIYLPWSKEEMRYELAHEREHIRHGDPAFKLFGWALVVAYWFCPLMWAAWALFDRDLELACDERVISRMTSEERIAYSEALLAGSRKRKKVPACPLSFGANGVKARIKSVLCYRKPAFWVSLGAVCIAMIAAVCFLTDPQPAIELPKAEDVINAAIEQIGEKGSGGLVVLEQKEEIDRLLDAVSGARKTNRLSVNDEPSWSSVDHNSYFILKFNQENGERLICYLYEKGGSCLLERPYEGVYRTDLKGMEEISKLYEEGDSAGYAYSLFRFGADGQVNAGTSLLAGGRAAALSNIVEACIAASTYTDGTDISGLQECYRIDVNFEDDSRMVFYVYEKDGAAFAQPDPEGKGIGCVKLNHKLYEDMQGMLEE